LVDSAQTLARNDSAEMAQTNLGYILLQRGDLQGAETHLERATKISPQYAETHNNLANLYIAAQRPGRAEEAASRGVACGGPDPAAALNLRTVARTMLGKFAEALADYDASLAASPNSAGVLVNKAMLYMRMIRPGDACVSLRAAVKVEPGLFEAHALLAQALIATRESDQAIIESREALRLRPSDGSAQALLRQATAGAVKTGGR